MVGQERDRRRPPRRVVRRNPRTSGQSVRDSGLKYMCESVAGAKRFPSGEISRPLLGGGWEKIRPENLSRKPVRLAHRKSSQSYVARETKGKQKKAETLFGSYISLSLFVFFDLGNKPFKPS